MTVNFRRKVIEENPQLLCLILKQSNNRPSF